MAGGIIRPGPARPGDESQSPAGPGRAFQDRCARRRIKIAAQAGAAIGSDQLFNYNALSGQLDLHIFGQSQSGGNLHRLDDAYRHRASGMRTVFVPHLQALRHPAPGGDLLKRFDLTQLLGQLLDGCTLAGDLNVHTAVILLRIYRRVEATYPGKYFRFSHLYT